jgi:hypothetical protein
MLEWTCTPCKAQFHFEESERRKVTGKHCKVCVFRNKTAADGWPVAAIRGAFCCPFRYRGCLFSGTIDGVHRHCTNSTKCPGAEIDKTPVDIFGPVVALLSPKALGDYLEAQFPLVSIITAIEHYHFIPIYLRSLSLPMFIQGKPHQSYSRLHQSHCLWTSPLPTHLISLPMPIMIQGGLHQSYSCPHQSHWKLLSWKVLRS